MISFSVSSALIKCVRPFQNTISDFLNMWLTHSFDSLACFHVQRQYVLVVGPERPRESKLCMLSRPKLISSKGREKECNPEQATEQRSIDPEELL